MIICASRSGKEGQEKRGQPQPQREVRGGGGRVTHADSSLGAGVRSAVTEETAALLAGFQLRAAVAALAGTHQAARAVVQHRSHPGGAGRRHLGAPGRAGVWAALSRSHLGAGEKRRNLSAGSIRQSDPAGAAQEGKVTRHTHLKGAPLTCPKRWRSRTARQRHCLGRLRLMLCTLCMLRRYPPAFAKRDFPRCGLALLASRQVPRSPSCPAPPAQAL